MKTATCPGPRTSPNQHTVTELRRTGCLYRLSKCRANASSSVVSDVGAIPDGSNRNMAPKCVPMGTRNTTTRNSSESRLLPTSTDKVLLLPPSDAQCSHTPQIARLEMQ